MQTIKRIVHSKTFNSDQALEELKDAPYFTPKLNKVKVIKVHDGDTFHVIGNTFEEFGAVGYHKYVVRLRDIDAPEINSRTFSEEVAAERAKDILTDLILDKIIELKDIGKDKYGRLLCHCFIGETNVSEYMLSQNCGYKYQGGKKKEWPDTIVN